MLNLGNIILLSALLNKLDDVVVAVDEVFDGLDDGVHSFADIRVVHDRRES